MWGNHCAVISTALSLYLGNFKNKSEASPTVRKTAQKLIEFTLNMETVITLVYWNFTHEIHMEKGRKMGNDYVYMALQVLLHSAPYICLILNVFFSRVAFDVKSWIFTMLASIAFMGVNCMTSIYFDIALYYFLPWNNDVKHALKYAAYLVGFSTLIYPPTAMLVNILPLTYNSG